MWGNSSSQLIYFSIKKQEAQNPRVHNNISMNIWFVWALLLVGVVCSEAALLPPSSSTFENKLKRFAKDISKKELCDFCQLLMPMVRNLVHRNKTAHLGDIAAYLCNKRLRISDETVCQMAVQEYEVLQIHILLTLKNWRIVNVR